MEFMHDFQGVKHAKKLFCQSFFNHHLEKSEWKVRENRANSAIFCGKKQKVYAKI